jgi:signal transduction histidine kinase
MNQGVSEQSSRAWPAVSDSPDQIASDIAAVGRIESVPQLLDILCSVTGMGFSAVARVTDGTWTLCAVKDKINFGLLPGGQLPVNSTLCIEARTSGSPIVIDQASSDPVYRDHHTPRTYRIESYVSVPIVMPNGRYFGNLCAIDPRPAQVSNAKTLALFTGFAEILAVQLGEELRREEEKVLLKDARDAAELREQIIAILGHDLRNPLQAVMAASEVLQRKLTDPAHVSLATVISTSGRRMSAMINDTLDFTRARLGGGIGVQLKIALDVGKKLSAIANEFRESQPRRKIVTKIEVEIPVFCDVGRLQQVASNLIGNALTHGSKDGAVIFTAEVTADQLIMEVWNDGEPIPPDSIGKVFEPFWRQNTSSDRQGLGLGLHICAQIVRAHHGSLAVSSSAQDGTKFTVRLPLRAKT